MKPLIIAAAFFIYSLVSFAQGNDYAEIKFMPFIYTKGMVGNMIAAQMKNSSFKLYMNDKLITSLRVDEILNYKVHSKGRITFTLADQSGQTTGSIELSENKTYYVVVGHEYSPSKKVSYRNQEIPADVAEVLKTTYELGYKNTINMEEDINNPIGKLPESLTKNAGQGTGFLLDDKGHVITNFHVIDGAKKITIKGINGDYATTLEATVVSSDKVNDLALLKINSSLVKFTNPPYAIISSKATNQGEKVFALGYPIKDIMGNEIKVTDGIINSKSGYKGSISQFQFSAPVQPGNSGGPLFNEAGEVIGIVTAKLNPEFVESAGYAIKSDYLLFFLTQIDGIEYKATERTTEKPTLSELVKKHSNFVFIIEVE